MQRLFLSTAFALALSAQAAFADPVLEALDSARSEYEAGNLSRAAAALITASKAIQDQQFARLATFLPEAPDWQRSVDDSAQAGMGMMGMAGLVAQANYSDDAGAYFTLTLTADSPLVASMAGILASPQMMAMMGKVVKIGGIEMLDQDGSLSALVGGRVLVQAQGAEVAKMLPVLGAIDFNRLATYDQ